MPTGCDNTQAGASTEGSVTSTEVAHSGGQDPRAPGEAPWRRLDTLTEAAREAMELFAIVRHRRTGYVNVDGGDPGCSGSERSLLRHTANYLAAAELVEDHGGPPLAPGATLVDVGGGVGAYSMWLARRLRLVAQLVDADPAVRTTAVRAFGLHAVASGEELPAGSAALVTAMEVVEHLVPSQQQAFVAGLRRLAAPGALVVISTPDESAYRGGWSGYAPHVGVLDAEGLHALLERATGLPAQVWRLDGDPFVLTAAHRNLLPYANRVAGVLRRAAPGAFRHLGGMFTATRSSLRGWRRETPDLDGRAWMGPADRGSGTGLLGIVRLPT